MSSYEDKCGQCSGDAKHGIQCIVGSLADVVRIWEALYDNFDVDDELLLTIEKREEQEDGTDRAD